MDWKKVVEEKETEKVRAEAEARSNAQQQEEQAEVVRGILKSMGIHKVAGQPLRKVPAYNLTGYYRHKDELIEARDSGAFVSFAEGEWNETDYSDSPVAVRGIDKYGNVHVIACLYG